MLVNKIAKAVDRRDIKPKFGLKSRRKVLNSQPKVFSCLEKKDFKTSQLSS